MPTPVPIHADRGNGRTHTAPARRRTGQTSTHGRLTDGHLKLHPDLHHLDGRDRCSSFAIITTTPNELCAQLHNRMPVVLKPESWPVWLGEKSADPSELKGLLAPLPSEEMTCWPVSARIGSVKNNDPSLIEPIAA